MIYEAFTLDFFGDDKWRSRGKYKTKRGLLKKLAHLWSLGYSEVSMRASGPGLEDEDEEAKIIGEACDLNNARFQP